MNITSMDKGQDRAGLAVASGAILLFLLMMLIHAWPPVLGDFVEWAYHAALLRDLLQGHADSTYTLKHYPVPNSLTTVGLGLLMLVLPWAFATKVWLLLGAVTGLVCARVLMRAGGGTQGWQTVVICSTLIFGGTFWYGFANFVWSVGFAMLFCGMLLSGVRSRWRYAAVLLLLFFTHMIPFGFALTALVLWAFQTGRWQVLLQAVPALSLTAWYLLARLLTGDADGKAGMVASVPFGTPLFVEFKLNTYLKSWGYVNPSYWTVDSLLVTETGNRVPLLLFGLDVAVAVAVLVLMVVAAWHALRARPRLGAWFFWVAVGLFAGFALLMPGALAGISDPGGRMMQVAIWCAVCVVRVPRRWMGWTLGAFATMLLAVSMLLLQTVALQPPRLGASPAALPRPLQQFGRVAYADRMLYYGAVDRGEMTRPIYPTALFLERQTAQPTR